METVQSIRDALEGIPGEVPVFIGDLRNEKRVVGITRTFISNDKMSVSFLTEEMLEEDRKWREANPPVYSVEVPRIKSPYLLSKGGNN